MYYTLLMLDRQLQITESTADILKKNVETVEAMKDAGIYNTTSAGVEQTRAAYAQVLASLPGMRQSIRETENALCLMLNQPAQEIERGVLENQQLPTEFSAGIPLQLLSNRPDVKAAEMSLAASYYDTNSARAAFYPQITLSGSAGWTNSAGSAIVNPAEQIAAEERRWLFDAPIAELAEVRGVSIDGGSKNADRCCLLQEAVLVPYHGICPPH